MGIIKKSSWRNGRLQLKSLDDITTSHRHIFLSPHFDDVVYSCGGTLGVQVSVGLRPLVITVFGGAPEQGTTLSPFAMDNHRRMGFGQDVNAAIQARRQEDVAAMELLGVDYLWLDYPDAIYRGNPAYYTQNSQIMGGEVNPGDRWIDEELAELLVSLSKRLPDTVWYAPLAVGRHVDHQIVCSAADRLTELGAKVNLYEDFPYVERNPGSLIERLEEFGNTLEPGLVEMSEMLPLRLQASAKYASQIGVNFTDEASMFKAMTTYTHNIRPVETVHLERYWTAR
jgi:LmbE family N-acetylglucosaminyl deacetylase